MDWSWQRIPAEYVVANVKLCRQGKLGRRKGFLHIRKGRISDPAILPGDVIIVKRRFF